MILISKFTKKILKQYFQKSSLLVISVIFMLTILVVAEAAYLLLPSGGEPRAYQNLIDTKAEQDTKTAFQKVPLKLDQFAKEREEWREKIKKIGGALAYAQFKQEMQETYGTDTLKMHTRAHVFGEALFEAEGIAGAAICDSSFAFGCYHSFFGKAISEHGLSVITDLDQVCLAKWGMKGLGCAHGIGHGVLWYFGTDKLVEAFAACRTLSWKGDLGGCSSGVFMEYNFNTMSDPEGGSTRPFDASDPYAPCNTAGVPGIYRQSCYFEIPDWWHVSLGEKYTEIGKLCAGVTDGNGSVDNDSLDGTDAEKTAHTKRLQQLCFQGLGKAIGPSSLFSAEKSITACSAMPSISSMIQCRQGAYWSFFTEPGHGQDAPAVCDNLSEADEAECVRGAGLI